MSVSVCVCLCLCLCLRLCLRLRLCLCLSVSLAFAVTLPIVSGTASATSSLTSAFLFFFDLCFFATASPTAASSTYTHTNIHTHTHSIGDYIAGLLCRSPCAFAQKASPAAYRTPARTRSEADSATLKRAGLTQFCAHNSEKKLHSTRVLACRYRPTARKNSRTCFTVLCS